MTALRTVAGITSCFLLLVGAAASARMIDVDFEGMGRRGPSNAPFQVLGALPSATMAAGPARDVTTSGSTLVALEDALLVLDGDSGELVLTDVDGSPKSRLQVAPEAAQMAVNRHTKMVYVADREHDTVWVISARGALAKVASIATPAEPYGLALTPNGKTLLITAVADRKLVAVDTDKNVQLWQREVAAEPRGVAISPEGDEATISFLQSGAVATVSLGKQPIIRYRSIGEPAAPKNANPRFGQPGFARAAFAAIYTAGGRVVVPHQRHSPVQVNVREDRGSYGGGSAPPIGHRLAFLGRDGSVGHAVIDAHMPRALAYDSTTDTLFVAGLGSDTVSAIAGASRGSPRLLWRSQLSAAPQAPPRQTQPRTQQRHRKGQRFTPSHSGPLQARTPPNLGSRCGPSGMDIAGGTLFVFCGLTRSVANVAAEGNGTLRAMSPAITQSRLSPEQLQGKQLFLLGQNTAMSRQGAMACASCHPEGRNDGLSWRIEGHTLQTPLIAGRLQGTHPFKWDGQDKDLTTSLGNTIKRLGGTGISPKGVSALKAYLLTMKPPRAPTPKNPAAVARGKEIFQSKKAGCATCHGGPQLTDGSRYDLAEDLPRVDTPSLIGVAHSAPYYHDGSAATLRAVVMENGSVHGMGGVAHLDSAQVGDLVAYLRTL